MPSSTVTVSSRSKSKTHGPMVSRLESASGPMTAIESLGRVEREQVSLVAQQHRGSLGRDAGHLAMCRIGEHLAGVVLVDVRRVEQAHPDLRLQHPPHARVDRLGDALPRLQRLGQVRVGGVGDRHLHVDPGVDGAGAGVGQIGGEAWVTRLRTALASLTTKPSNPHASRSTSVNSHGCRGRDAVQVHVGGHHVAGARLDRRLERREVDVPQLGVGQVDLVVVAPADAPRRSRRSAWGRR